MTTPRSAGVLLRRPPAPPAADFFSSEGWAEALPPFSSLSFFFSLAMKLCRSNNARTALRELSVYRQKHGHRSTAAHATHHNTTYLVGDRAADGAGVFDGAAHHLGEWLLDHEFFA